MLAIIEFRLESARSVTGAVALGAAALDHETRNDPMEGEAVIESVTCKRDEIVDMIGRDIVPEFDGDRAMGRFDFYCGIAHVIRVAQKRVPCFTRDGQGRIFEDGDAGFQRVGSR